MHELHAAGAEQGWALLAYAAVVSTVLGAGVLANGLDSGVPVAVAYGGISFGLAWSRRRGGGLWLPGAASREGRGGWLVALIGFAAGYASHPAWLGFIAWTGRALGLSSAEYPSSWDSPIIWTAAILLAPLWEELLYRERMLVAFRRAWGAVPAVVLSSAAFALPHAYGGSWALLGTFLVGMALAGVALAGRSVWLCVAIHAGLNLGALAWQHGQAWMVPAPEVSAVAGWLGLGGALALLRRGRVRSREIAPARLEVA